MAGWIGRKDGQKDMETDRRRAGLWIAVHCHLIGEWRCRGKIGAVPRETCDVVVLRNQTYK